MIKDVYPAFASPVCFLKLENNWDQEYEKIKTTYELVNTSDKGNLSLISKCLFVLDNHPELRDDILKCFNLFQTEVLGYKNVNFAMTTSWLTKTEKGQYSKQHCHKNSVYSGVLFLEDSSEQTGLFHISDASTPKFWSFGPKYIETPNIFNQDDLFIKPEKNLIVIFPSHLQHEITQHMSEECRHSIAFNMFPNGEYMNADSSINVTIR